MNGIELLQLIKTGKIENDTIISVYYDDEDLGKTLICELRYINNQIYWEEGTFKVSYLYNDSYSFQIVEEEKDTEELDLFKLQCTIANHYSKENIQCLANEMVRKMNKLRDAVNELKNKG